jgi:hypothetical protein
LLPDSCFSSKGRIFYGLLIALIKLAWALGTLGFGIFLLYRKFPLETGALTLTMLFYAFFTACTVIMDGRYLLPFAVFIFTAQATAINEGLRRFIIWLGNIGVLAYQDDIDRRTITST